MRFLAVLAIIVSCVVHVHGTPQAVTPTVAPTAPTAFPSPAPTGPSAEPTTPVPTTPTGFPSPAPTGPSGEPTPAPTTPTAFPSPAPTGPSGEPTPAPTTPTAFPSPAPTGPSAEPTVKWNYPTEAPILAPTDDFYTYPPTYAPLAYGATYPPTASPTRRTRYPTPAPTEEPTAPTVSAEPTVKWNYPTEAPILAPTDDFYTYPPTYAPLAYGATYPPTASPTRRTRYPTPAPTEEPTAPTVPSAEPTVKWNYPTEAPILAPTDDFYTYPPTYAPLAYGATYPPTASPTRRTRYPTPAPTEEPTWFDDAAGGGLSSHASAECIAYAGSTSASLLTLSPSALAIGLGVGAFGVILLALLAYKCCGRASVLLSTLTSLAAAADNVIYLVMMKMMSACTDDSIARWVFGLAVVFFVASLITNWLLAYKFFKAELARTHGVNYFAAWFAQHRAFAFVVAALSGVGFDTLHLPNTNLFKAEALSAEVSKAGVRSLQLNGVAAILVQTLPMIALQAYTAFYQGWTPIVLGALVGNAALLLLALFKRGVLLGKHGLHNACVTRMLGCVSRSGQNNAETPSCPRRAAVALCQVFCCACGHRSELATNQSVHDLGLDSDEELSESQIAWRVLNRSRLSTSEHATKVPASKKILKLAAQPDVLAAIAQSSELDANRIAVEVFTNIGEHEQAEMQARLDHIDAQKAVQQRLTEEKLVAGKAELLRSLAARCAADPSVAAEDAAVAKTVARFQKLESEFIRASAKLSDEYNASLSAKQARDQNARPQSSSRVAPEMDASVMEEASLLAAHQLRVTKLRHGFNLKACELLAALKLDTDGVNRNVSELDAAKVSPAPTLAQAEADVEEARLAELQRVFDEKCASLLARAAAAGPSAALKASAMRAAEKQIAALQAQLDADSVELQVADSEAPMRTSSHSSQASFELQRAVTGQQLIAQLAAQVMVLEDERERALDEIARAVREQKAQQARIISQRLQAQVDAKRVRADEIRALKSNTKVAFTEDVPELIVSPSAPVAAHARVAVSVPTAVDAQVPVAMFAARPAIRGAAPHAVAGPDILVHDFDADDVSVTIHGAQAAPAYLPRRAPVSPSSKSQSIRA